MHPLARTAPILAALLGAAAVFASVPLVGRTMAIATPAGTLEWLRDTVSSEFASFIWDLLVVFGPTLGLLLLFCALVLRFVYRGPGAGSSVFLAVGALLGLYLFVPIALGEPFLRPLPWWASAAEASVLAACVASIPLLRRKQC